MPVICPNLFLFNLSLRSGEFLDSWKFSYITPVYKSGPKQNIENYRPIAKLQLIPKIFESIVKRKIYEAVKNHISIYQHGFVQGRSTSTNLTLFVNFCLRNMENKCQTDVIFTDFSKAFDRVSHRILLKKLSFFGFHSFLLKWLSSYLCDRSQFVKIGSTLSFKIYNHSGVPQGSHLGPLLFLIFVNDLPTIINFSKCLMFADDVKIFMSIKSVADSLNFQKDIEKLKDWCSTNSLSLNLNKCSVMSFSRSTMPILFNYMMGGVRLQRVVTQKDLGVIFDLHLSFSVHIDYIISRANAMSGFLFRNSHEFRDPYTLKTLFVALVRPILEYCCVVWSPLFKKDYNRIEKIQKRFTKFALRKLNWSCSMPSYDSRCLLIGLKPLSSRITYYSVIFARDVLTNHIECPPLLALFGINAPSRALRPRSNFFLHISRHATNYGQNEPITNACVKFNQYANVFDFNQSRNSFKSLIMLMII